MKNPVVYICGLVIILSLSFVMRALLPSGNMDARAVEEGTQVTYFCTETKQTVVGPAQSTPAVNPTTGRSTLVRALYCPIGKRWWPAPSADAYGGNPLAARCPHHRVPMSPSGPPQTVATATP